MADELRIALTTCAEESSAEDLAYALIESGLAACVQIDSHVRSYYRWEGSVQNERECRLVIKFLAKNSDKLASLLHEKHPYEVPQWIVLEAKSVGSAYLDWASQA